MAFENTRDFTEKSRIEARGHAREGIASLALAFNHCGRNEVAHRYADAVQSQFLELAAELIRLIEYGDIETNPAHGLYLQAQGARSDKALQAVIRKASRKTPIRTR
jgi:hypothetical protein